jgi:lipoprotein-releasing system ATP-binding protein
MSEPSAAPAGTPVVPSERPIALFAKGIHKTYRMGAASLEVLKGVDLEVREGEILAILGKSGCGKSTLLHILGWLDHADRGEVHYEGRDRTHLPNADRARLRNVVMGFVFQFYHLLPELTALENVLVPSMIRYGALEWGAERRKARDRARALLAIVGLGGRMEHRTAQLSGGERQRVAIARALQNQPRFLLCDEPTGNLDGKTAEDVRRLLWELNGRENQTTIVVTHDARLAAQAHRIVHLVDGRIAEQGEAPLVEEIAS